MIILLVFSVYGISLLNMSVSDVKHAKLQEDKTQAYYLARSGAEALSSYIVNNLDNLTQEEREAFINSIHNKISSPTRLSPSDRGYFEVRLTKAEEYLTIQSTGVIEGSNVRETVTLNIQREVTEGGGGSTNPLPSFDMAFYATAHGSQGNPAIKMTGSTSIWGSVGTNTTGKNSIQMDWSNEIVNGKLYIGPGADPNTVVQTPRGNPLIQIQGGIENITEVREYPMPEFPSFPEDLPSKGSFTTPKNNVFYYISQDGEYDLIEATSNRDITIDLQGGDRIIRVKDLNISQGTIKLQNTGENGRLILYVEKSFKLKGSSYFNKGGNFNNVLLYYKGNESIDLGGNTEFIGNIFVENADIIINGSGGLMGNIISGGRKIEISGAANANTRIFYAPNTHVEVKGSGSIKGAVIAGSISTSGGSKPAIHFIPPDLDQFPVEIFTSGSDGGNNNPTTTITYQIGGWK